MSARQRYERIELLIGWAKEQSPKWVREYTEGCLKGALPSQHKIIRELGSMFYWTVIANEARKRWAVSRHTANDYAEIVSHALEKEHSKNLEAMAKEIGFQVVDDETYLRYAKDFKF